jgi:hypothetical protein
LLWRYLFFVRWWHRHRPGTSASGGAHAAQVGAP